MESTGRLRPRWWGVPMASAEPGYGGWPAEVASASLRTFPGKTAYLRHFEILYFWKMTTNAKYWHNCNSCFPSTENIFSAYATSVYEFPSSQTKEVFVLTRCCIKMNTLPRNGNLFFSLEINQHLVTNFSLSISFVSFITRWKCIFLSVDFRSDIKPLWCKSRHRAFKIGWIKRILLDGLSQHGKVSYAINNIHFIPL